MLTGTLLAIVSGLCWGGTDALRKVLGGRADPIALAGALALLQIPLFVGWALIAGDLRFDHAYWPSGLAALTLNILANACFMWSMKLSPLSVTIPMLALTPALSALVGALGLGEWLSAVQVAGMGAVVAGALIINATVHDLGHPLTLLRSLGRERGSLLMAVVAASWAGTAALDKLAMREASAPLHGTIQLIGVAIPLLAWAWARGGSGRIGALRHQVGPLLGATVTGGAAMGLQLVAYTHIFIGVVEAIKRALGLGLAVVNGRLFFGETLRPIKLVAVALMGAGVAAVILG